MTSPILSIRELKVHFPLKQSPFFPAAPIAVRAVDGVSFDLGAGETLGIVGESGCGKSTLGRAILQLIAVTGGTVTWRGQQIGNLPPETLRLLRRELQIIFQDPLASLDPRMTVGRSIAKPLEVFEPKLRKKDRQARVDDMLQRVGLSADMAGRYPHEFSGGQCQRIGIARAMIGGPQLIVCDEPVSALDVSIQAQIINLLGELKRDAGMALLFISHNLSVVRHISDRIMVLYLGKVMELAPRDLFYARPMHPYSQALLSAVPVADPVLERRRQRIRLSGELPSPINPPAGCRLCGRCPKATQVCAEEEPQLRDPGDGRLVACHHLD
ncbi:MAG: oligopeptide/dipeptide ABC transporter ATP-binding protein [Dongiaceae bacterium]